MYEKLIKLSIDLNRKLTKGGVLFE